MLLDINTPKKRMILCYLNGTHHFELFYNIFHYNPDIDFYIISKNINEDDYRKSGVYNLDNVFFVAETEKLIYKLNCFGALITTDIQQARAHKYSLKIANLFYKLHIPVIELQHGLFQLGLHYYDMPNRENFRDDSLPTKSFAEHILTYYPISNYKNITTIGYPPYNEDHPTYQGEYTLILSNMHWPIYSPEEKYNFYKTILQYVEHNHEKMFIWKMHHGEMKNTTMLKELFNVFPTAKKNIILYQDNAMLQKNSITNLIAKADKVISTVSTVLLDCERWGKDTYTYSSNAINSLVKKLKNPQAFTNIEDLEILVNTGNKRFETGLLHKYDNDAFKRTINHLYKETDLSPKDMLNIILDVEI